MAKDNFSGFGGEFRDLPVEPVEGQFREENICGRGAFSTVYRVRLDGEQVAAKRLDPAERLNPVLIAAFRKEFEIGKRLRHIGLPVYRQLRADNAEVFIIMDFIDGFSLDDFTYTDEGKLFFRNEENVRDLMIQLLDVLSYLHRCGVIHCDVKPGNIILRHSDNAAMLIDLDKAYSDTYDLTHGGTPGISEILDFTEKPTKAKDFAALGRVLEKIYGGEKDIPRRFRRFMRECKKPDTSAEQLKRTLRAPSSRSNIAIVASLILTVIILLVLFLPRRERDVTDHPVSQEASNPSSENVREEADDDAAISGKDTASPVEVLPTYTTDHTPTPSEGKDKITDFDARMAKYIDEVARVTTEMRSGKLSIEELQQRVTNLSDLYTSLYNKIMDDYRREHPEASESEAYQAITDALGQSETLKILNSFSREFVDTINARSQAVYPGGSLRSKTPSHKISASLGSQARDDFRPAGEGA